MWIMKKMSLLKVGLAGVLLSIFTLSCSKESLETDITGTDRTISAQNVDPANIIGIKDNGYSKPDHWVGRYTTIMWVNGDSKVHSVTADDGSFDSGPIQPGGSYSREFPKIAIHKYHDRYGTAEGMITIWGREEPGE
jgi:plastocyanin